MMHIYASLVKLDRRYECLMVEDPARRDRMAVAIQAYLETALGYRPQLTTWHGVRSLAQYLQDAYDFRELSLPNRRLLLAIDRYNQQPMASIRSQLTKVQAATSAPVVYVAPALASFERRRLIEQRVAFLVPGNQLYIPEIGVDIQERPRRAGRERRAC